MRKFFVLLILSALILSASSCGKREPVYVNLSDLAGQLQSEGYLDGFVKADDGRIKMEYGLTGAETKQIEVYLSESAYSAGEVFMCEAADDDSKANIVSRLKNRRVNKQLMMTNYVANPNFADEYADITRSGVTVRDMFVFYVISPNDKAVNGVINSAIKGA